MLILTRRIGESIVCRIAGIEMDIVVMQPNNPNSKQVKLGFTAPYDIEILRKELLEREDQ